MGIDIKAWLFYWYFRCHTIACDIQFGFGIVLLLTIPVKLIYPTNLKWWILLTRCVMYISLTQLIALETACLRYRYYNKKPTIDILHWFGVRVLYGIQLYGDLSDIYQDNSRVEFDMAEE